MVAVLWPSAGCNLCCCRVGSLAALLCICARLLGVSKCRPDQRHEQQQYCNSSWVNVNNRVCEKHLTQHAWHFAHDQIMGFVNVVELFLVNGSIHNPRGSICVTKCMKKLFHSLAVRRPLDRSEHTTLAWQTHAKTKARLVVRPIREPVSERALCKTTVYTQTSLALLCSWH